MSINYGTKNLAITKSSIPYKNLHSFVSYDVNTEGISAIKHSNDIISYRVFPGKINLQTLQEAQGYFAKNGFELKVNNSTKDKRGNLESITLSFGKETKTFIINNLKHLIKLKSEKNGKFYRQDESIILEADTKTLETKIFVENRMFKIIEKSSNWQIKAFVVNKIRTQIDSSKFTHPLALSSTLPDNFEIYEEGLLLIEEKDFIKKHYKIFLKHNYKNITVKYSMSDKSVFFRPELTKLKEIAFPKLNSVTNPPLAFLSKESVDFPIRGIKEKRKYIY